MPLSERLQAGLSSFFFSLSLSLFLSFFSFFLFYVAMLICVYLKVSCGLEFLAELDFLLVWTLDGEELYAVLPEWQTIYLLIQHLEGSGFLYN